MTQTGEHVAVFPGTFDPITNGHLDVVRRGRHLFDRLIVGIGRNPEKRQLFNQAEREQIVRQLVESENLDVEVIGYSGLTVDFARRVNANAILRGIRNFTDLQYEFQLALTNRAVADIETIFIMSGETYGLTSSSLIRQIAASGNLDRLRPLLPEIVIQRMRDKHDQIRSMFTDGNTD